MASFDIRAYARAGAAARLREIEAERAVILSEFPDLRARPAGPAAAEARPVAAAGRTRKRRTISAEGRKRISEAQKRRWAAQRAKDSKRSPSTR